jgi:Peptidase family M28
MRKHALIVFVPLAVAFAMESIGHAQAQGQPHVRHSEVGGRLAPADQQYGAISGVRLKGYVEELAQISRRYRDNGHPQFWGRIIGTPADAENAQWMLQKFRALGMTDVREQVIDLAPQWIPQSWSVTASAAGKTLQLETAQPTYGGVGTPAGGLDLEAVYAGLGSDADIALARDVRGKAVFFYSTDLTSRHVGVADEAVRRLGERGAAVIFIIQGLPGNLRTQFYPVQSKIPTFTLGQRDGLAMRDMIGATAAGSAPRVRVKLDTQMVPNLKSGTVWGTLPGTSDETVFIVAHRDGWFDGANDNGAGVATMIGLAEFFAKLTPQQRKRTITFLGTTGHHNSGANSGAWFAEHPEVFAKASLLINSEHTGAAQSAHYSIRNSNTAAPSTWYASGTRLAAIVMNALDAFGVSTLPEASARPAGEIGRYFQLAPSVQVMSTAFVWHSDGETPETISTTGLEAVTRAYAKIVVDSNAVDIKELRELR